MIYFPKTRKLILFLIILFIPMTFTNCQSYEKIEVNEYEIVKSLKSNNKNSVYWAEQFLINKGMKELNPIDFNKKRSEEILKIQKLISYWETIKEKEKLDKEFLIYRKKQSPIWLEKWQ